MDAEARARMGADLDEGRVSLPRVRDLLDALDAVERERDQAIAALRWLAERFAHIGPDPLVFDCAELRITGGYGGGVSDAKWREHVAPWLEHQ